MKNERRQKLAKNSLATILENSVNNIKEQSATITRLILVILIAVLIVVLWRKFTTGNIRDFYNDKKQLIAYDMSVLDADKFGEIVNTYIKKYPTGVNNATISLLIGDIYFNYASGALAKGDREKAIANFEMALQYYTTADKFQFKQQDLAESAVLGLAQTNESLAVLQEGDNFTVAKVLYERLCKTWPDGAWQELASRQLDWLNRPVAEAFLEKYRYADPALFAQDMKTTETIEPGGTIDTTISPGEINIQSLIDNIQAERTGDEVPIFEPGLTLPEEQPQAEAQENVPEPVPESDFMP